MFSARWQLCRMLGIPIYVDLSWLVILVLLTISLVNLFPSLLREYFPDHASNPPTVDYAILSFLTALVFFGCILLHELGHAVVGRALGIPIRGITLFMFGGVAEMGAEPPSAASEFWMAIAGPLVSLALAIGLAVVAVLGALAAWPAEVVVALFYLAVINGVLIVFNMIPAFPLDGGRVFRSIVWGATGDLRRATGWATQSGQVFAWFLVGLGLVQIYNGQWLGGIWSGLIALFLSNAARESYAQVVTRDLLEREPIGPLVHAEIAVPPTLDLQHWVNDFVDRYHRKTFPVADTGHVLGLINTDALARFPRREWHQHSVREVMRRDVDAVSISPDADAWQALEKMQRSGANRLLVTDADRLVGTVTMKDLEDLLTWKLELESNEEDGGPTRGPS